MATNTRAGQRVRVGTVGVDAGMVMVGDPCYMAEFVRNSKIDRQGYFDCVGQLVEGLPANHEHQFNYVGAADASMSVASGGQLGDEQAVCVSSGWGDGSYPVYVTYDSDGRVASLVVEFTTADEDIESEEDDEDGWR